jgi:fibronectin type 3 domain-containing protein
MKSIFVKFALFACIGSCWAQGGQGRVLFSGNVRINATGHSASLTWQTSGGTSYNVYRGTAHGGPYTKIASGIPSPTYNDAQVTHNQTLYYVVTAVSGGNESGYSNEAVATIP